MRVTIAWCAAVADEVDAEVVAAAEDDDAAAALLELPVLLVELLPQAASRAAVPTGTSASTGFMSNSP
jgi:hypothetical protein